MTEIRTPFGFHIYRCLHSRFVDYLVSEASVDERDYLFRLLDNQLRFEFLFLATGDGRLTITTRVDETQENAWIGLAVRTRNRDGQVYDRRLFELHHNVLGIDPARVVASSQVLMEDEIAHLLEVDL